MQAVNMDWMSVKEAARLVGYSAPYFREVFCAQGAPLVEIRVRLGKSGRRPQQYIFL